MVSTRAPAAAPRRSKTASQVGDQIIAKRREDLGLGDDVLPFLEDAAGRFFAYNGTFWEEMTEASLKALVFSHFPGSNNTRRVEVIHYLCALCHRRDHSWERVADHEVPFRNGVLDVLSGRLRPHRAEDYLESVIPWDYDRAARESDALQEYFNSCFGETDIERPRALQEFAGYVLMHHAKYKKALFLYGPTDSGKSQFALLLRQLVGRDACCALSVEAMDDPMRRAVLVGKLLNVLTELPADAMIRDGGFKQLVSTGDPIEINPKHHKPFSYQPVAKLVIVSNDLPRINDRTEATVNRLLVVPFTRTIPKDEQDPDLQEKFTAQMAGIVRWAAQGARKLVEARGRFSTVELASVTIREMREQSNPIIAFVRQMMIEDGTAVVPATEITGAFNRWKAGGKAHEVRQVTRMLRQAFGEDAVGNAWHPATKQSASCLKGYRMRVPSEMAVEGANNWVDGPPE
jgi:P4 family phage/plasmid primase-like protien